MRAQTVRGAMVLAVLLTLVLMAAALMLAGGFAIVQGLSPLGKLSGEVEKRDLDRLDRCQRHR